LSVVEVVEVVVMVSQGQVDLLVAVADLHMELSV
jgi:hypothetical protein